MPSQFHTSSVNGLILTGYEWNNKTWSAWKCPLLLIPLKQHYPHFYQVNPLVATIPREKFLVHFEFATSRFLCTHFPSVTMWKIMQKYLPYMYNVLDIFISWSSYIITIYIQGRIFHFGSNVFYWFYPYLIFNYLSRSLSF